MIVVPLKIKLISSLAVGTLIFVINLLWMPSTLMRTEELIMPKMVVFSSDDWGRWTDVIPLWPNLEYQEEFIRNGGSFPPKLMNWIYGTVETEQDIKKFFDLINDLNKDVRFEHRVVITPFWVVGGPDYQSMRKNGCPYNSSACKYEELLVNQSATGMSKSPFKEIDLRPLYRIGFESGLWHPEYHARAHFNAHKWVTLMTGNDGEIDSNARICFEMGLVCAKDRVVLQSEENIFKSESEQMEWFRGGDEAFQKFWGYKSLIHSSPHNVTGNFTLAIMANLGFIGADNPVGQNLENFREMHISTVNRMRFDPFASDFDSEKAWTDIKKALEARGFVSLAFHAQNTFSSTFSPIEYDKHLAVLKNFVYLLRNQYPNSLVFLTSSELHQIKSRGWSVEIWSDGFLYRNFNRRSVKVKVMNLKNHYEFGEDWNLKLLKLRLISTFKNVREKFQDNRNHVENVLVGDEIELLPMASYWISSV